MNREVIQGNHEYTGIYLKIGEDVTTTTIGEKDVMNRDPGVTTHTIGKTDVTKPGNCETSVTISTFRLTAVTTFNVGQTDVTTLNIGQTDVIIRHTLRKKHNDIFSKNLHISNIDIVTNTILTPRIPSIHIRQTPL